MTVGRTGIEHISSALSLCGLSIRGGFNFLDSDGNAPLAAAGKTARSVLLVGNAGAAYWPHFQRWRQVQPPDIADPLDTWCRGTIGALAKQVGARAVSPSDRPYLPFQRWAMRAEGLKPSPLGILMHPRYGLWHAYRGALLFAERLGLAAVETPIHLCDLCRGKPCLSACPTGAYSVSGFDHAACLSHVRSPAGVACMAGGCLARNACPHGAGFRYPAEVQAYHQSWFARR